MGPSVPARPICAVANADDPLPASGNPVKLSDKRGFFRSCEKAIWRDDHGIARNCRRSN
jgi:hypothetical protein